MDKEVYLIGVLSDDPDELSDTCTITLSQGLPLSQSTISQTSTNSYFEAELLKSAETPKINIMTPELVAALDRANVSSRNATYILAAALKGAGIDLHNVNLSYSTIHRKRILLREDIAKKLKENLKLNDNYVVHWDVHFCQNNMTSLFLYQGHQLNLDGRHNVNGNQRYRCLYFDSVRRCPVKLWRLSNGRMLQIGQHNHMVHQIQPNPPQRRPAPRVPNANRRQPAHRQSLPPTPSTFEELEEILLVLRAADNIYQGHVKDNSSMAYIFSNDRSLKLLSESSEWHINMCFQCAPLMPQCSFLLTILLRRENLTLFSKNTDVVVPPVYCRALAYAVFPDHTGVTGLHNSFHQVLGHFFWGSSSNRFTIKGYVIFQEPVREVAR
ncbi:Protein of unknown function [Cotesia congregata]|uniref:Uncharacterized protein n=1 Tax=Cotesia congregata TaxID=51543 RepID=A0A8J2E0X8_COTCN|nr:Protein of unknown function [Cotesia congregata]